MRPTGDGIAVGVLAALLLFVAVNLQAGWVYAVDALLIAVLAVGWLSARLGSQGLMITREMTPEAFEGDRITVTLRVMSAQGRRYFIEVRDAVPGLSSHATVAPECDAQRPALATYHAHALRRGVHRVESVEVRCAGLTGFFVSRRHLPAGGVLTVFPRYWVMTDFPVPGRAGAEATSAPQPGRDGLEIAGVRDFRDGDTLRHVHWRSTARRGTLIVREFEREIHQPVALLLDTRPPASAVHEADDRFEDMVRAAASIAYAVTRSGRAVYLIAASGTQVLRAAAGWSQALHWLARIQSEGALGPADVYAAGVPEGTPVVICSPDADAVAALAQRGIPLAAVLVDAASYGQSAQSTRSSQSPQSNAAAPGSGGLADRVDRIDSDTGEMLLRALGVPVAVLRRGEEVGACLASFTR